MTTRSVRDHRGGRRLAPAGTGIAAVALVGLLTACTGTSGPSPSASSAGASASVPAVVNISPVKPQRAIPADKDIVEVPALRKSITLSGCEASGKGWAGTGTAANPGSATAKYHILVFFTDRYSRTIDYATTTVTVPGGQSADWKASATFSPPAGTQCVLRGLYEEKA